MMDFALAYRASPHVDRLSNSTPGLPLGCLAAHGAKAFDAQLLPCLLACLGPSGNILVALLTAGGSLLASKQLRFGSLSSPAAYDLAPLVDLQVGLLQARVGLLLVAILGDQGPDRRPN